LSTNTEALLETAKLFNEPTIEQLIDSLVKEKGFKETKAIETVYTEWKKGRLKLSEPNTTISIIRYFFGIENVWFWAITTIITATIVCIFTVESSSMIYIRYALGGVFVLFLPGFMLISALYPRSEEMDGLERLALSIGLSLAIVPLVGLGLNYTPWGIKLTPIVISLAMVVEVLAVVCVFRRFRYYILNLK
jgi:hypothetical protein